MVIHGFSIILTKLRKFYTGSRDISWTCKIHK